MKYMIWNNKGGVGKTFLTYLLASEYAIKHPDEDVIVADLCPQANVSEMMLGGNGKGESNLEKLWQNDNTIAGYIKARYQKSPNSKLGTELKYFIKVNSYNGNMPPNLFLLPGDTDLDICSAIINFLGQAPQKGAWARSRRFLVDLIESIENDRKGKKIVFFFDCNPSFANYTEMAVIAADRIIVPCTADSASVRGIHNVFRVVYGVEVSNKRSTEVIEEDAFDTFVTKAKEAGITFPKIHLFVQNKSRVLDSEATIAFKAHIDAIKKIINTAKRQSPENFTSNAALTINVKDGDTLASIANHTGLPLSSITHGKYDVYGKKTQANKSQIEALLKQVKQCVAVL